MYFKHLISVPVLLASVAACSGGEVGDDDSVSGGTGGSSGAIGKGGTAGTGAPKGGSGGSSGSTGATGGTGGSVMNGGTGGSAMGGSAGNAAGGSSGTAGMGTGGSTGGMGMGGALPMGGSSGMGGGAGTGNPPMGGMGGTAAGGAGSGGGGTGGMPAGGSGGSGPPASFKCENLTLAPSTTGVAKPSGAAGGLKVLDWAGFKGAASFTFDDNTPSQMQNYTALKMTGGHFTWFVVGSWLSGNSSLISQYKATIADGQEMANHTQSHSSSASQSDLSQAESFISSSFGVNANSMAAPNCASAWASVAPMVLFQNRGPCSNGGPTVSPRDNTDPFQLPAYLPNTGEAASSMSASITAGKWRIFVIHGFDSQGGTYQPVPIGNVTDSMKKAVSDGFWVEGISNVGAYWQGQKAISASATTSATWTLPAKFPPNMCVRITTTGGTVTQKGEAIPWNDHGYYEISLDAKEVTIQ